MMMIKKVLKIVPIDFIKYGLIGVAGTALHTATIAIGVEVWGLNPLFASFIGFIISLTVSFVLNTIWTFRSEFKLKLFYKYAAVCTTGLLLNLFIIYMFNTVLGLWYLIGQFVAILVVPLFNFIVNKLWVFYRAERIIDKT